MYLIYSSYNITVHYDKYDYHIWHVYSAIVRIVVGATLIKGMRQISYRSGVFHIRRH